MGRTLAGAMYAPKLVKEVLKALGKQLVGWTASVCTQLDQTQTFLSWTQEWQEYDYDQQGNLLDPIKVKGGKRQEIDWVLKQKLFDYVPESECVERQPRPY